MPNLDETAIGIASVLAGLAPEPLPIQLRGETIDQAACLVRAVIRECADADIRLHRVMVDDELFGWLERDEAQPVGCPLAPGGHHGEVLFFRRG